MAGRQHDNVRTPKLGEYTITALTSEPNIRVKTCHTTLSGKGSG